MPSRWPTVAEDSRTHCTLTGDGVAAPDAFGNKRWVAVAAFAFLKRPLRAAADQFVCFPSTHTLSPAVCCDRPCASLCVRWPRARLANLCAAHTPSTFMATVALHHIVRTACAQPVSMKKSLAVHGLFNEIRKHCVQFIIALFKTAAYPPHNV